MNRSVLFIAVLCGVLYGALSVQLAQAEELPTFQVVAKNGHFEPTKMEVPAGKRIKIVVKNEGPGPEEFESADLRIEKVIAAGASSFVVINNLKPGTYRFIGEFHAETAKLDVIAK